MAQLQETFLFSPTSVSNCVMWFDAADTSTVIRSGTNVTQWNDKTGNGNTATAGTATYPVYKPNSLNGLNTIGLQGANDYFLVSNNLTTTTYPSLCYFIIVNPSSTQPNTSYAGILSTDSPGQFGRTLGLGSGSWQQEYYSNFNNITAYTANTWALVSLQFFSTISATLAVNGTTFAGTASGTGNNTTGFKIGSYNNDGSYATFNANFDVGEILVYGANLSTTERQQIEGYLAWKWGLQASLPSTHPFRYYRTLANAPIPSLGIPLMPVRTQGTQPFAPPQISGCTLWFDAADRSSMVLSDSSVTRWNDKSGNQYNVTSGGTAPTYSSSSNAVVFNGNGYLINSTLSLPLANRSVFLVCSQTSSSSTAFEGFIVFGASNVVDYDSINAIVYNGRGANAIANVSFEVFFNYSQNNFGDYRLDYLTSATPTPFGIYNDVFANPSGTLYVNGSNITSDSITGSIGTSTGFFLGARNDFGNGTYRSFLNGSIYEIIVYNVAVSVAQRQQIEGYLAWKWGLTSSLPNGHPYKTIPIAPFPFRTTAFNGSVNQWQPTQISGLNLWLDASDRSTLVFTGANVTTWRDKSGNGYNATGTGNTTLTTFNTKYTGITLDGSTTYFNYTGGTAMNTTNFLSAFVVATFGNMGASDYRRLLSFGDPDYNNTANAVAFNRNATNNLIMYERSGFPTPAITLTPPADFFGATLFTPTGTTQFINSSFNASSTGTFGAFNYSLYNVGRYSGGGYIWTGTVCEVIVYNASFTTFQRQQLEGYMAWKWGMVGNLPANHPYKLYPPSP